LTGRGCITTLCFLSYILHVSAQLCPTTQLTCSCEWLTGYNYCTDPNAIYPVNTRNCGCVAASGMTSGTLQSIGHPSTAQAPSYFPGTRCKWIITAPAGSTISITFTYFDLESNHDFVYIYNCNQMTLACRVAGNSGFGVPSSPGQGNALSSSTGTLMVVLEADYSTQTTGFKATYAITNCGVCTAGTYKVTACISDAAGTSYGTCDNYALGHWSNYNYYCVPDGGCAKCCECANKCTTPRAATGGTSCTTCPAYSTSPVGSTAVTQCTCNSGYTGPAGGSCVASASISCSAGKEPISGQCQGCTPGKYKAAIGSSACISCAANYASAMEATTCMLCTGAIANALVLPASGSGGWAGYCGCNKGYYGKIFAPGYNVGLGTTFYNSYGGGTCTACAAGKYYWQPFYYAHTEEYPTCDSCGTNFPYSLPGSTTCQSIPLTCPVGQYLPSTSSTLCVICVAGTYKAVTGTQACANCAAGKYSAAGSIDCSDCAAGKYASSAGSSTCTVCDTGKTSPAGSDGVADCVCQGGWKVVGTYCEYCTAGTYAAAGASTCSTCPGGTYSADIAPQCTSCNAGYTSGQGAQNQCTWCLNPYFSFQIATGTNLCACNAGYWGEVNSAGTDPWGSTYNHLSINYAECTACPAGKYYPSTNQYYWKTHDSEALYGRTVVCFDCPAGKTSTPAAITQDACYTATPTTCPTGQYLPDLSATSCVACVAAKYKATTGTEACIDCPASSTSPTGSSALSSCTCNTGFTGPDGGSCTACAAGKYKTTTGSVACLDCGAGKYSTSTGATLEATCLACPSYSNSPSASASLSMCTCNVGFTGPEGGSCTACVAGKYKTLTGSAPCTDCGDGKYSTSTGATSSAACTNCGAGKYSTSIGAISSAVCTDCGAGKYSTSTGATSSAVCTDCGTGKYLTSTGASSSAACTNCVAGKYSTSTGATVETTCILCLSNSNSPSGSIALSSCTCNIGYTGPNGGTCAACAAGKYKTTSGSVACTDCAAGSYAALPGSIACTLCPSLRTSPVGSSADTQCTCISGYFQPSNAPTTCTALASCDPGYCSKIDTAGSWSTCDYCPLGKYKTTTTTELCAISCISCPAGMTTKYAGSNSRDLCTCNRGYIKLAGWETAGCTACPMGKYHWSYRDAMGYDPQCYDCPSGTTTLSVGSFYHDASDAVSGGVCVCGAGMRQTGSTTCGQCDDQSYKPTAGNIACTSCPTGKISYDTSKLSIQDCRCNTGYTGPDGSASCTPCPASTYKDVRGTTQCKSCANGNGYHELVAQTTNENCKCNAGYYGGYSGCSPCAAGTYKVRDVTTSTIVIDGNYCQPCTAGTYSGVAAGSCTACPLGSTSATRSTSVTSCTCISGYSGPAGGPCVALDCLTGYTGPPGSCTQCVAGTYKGVSGSAACDVCVAGKFSAGLGQISDTACQNCAVGKFSTAAASVCTNCAVGSYAAITGSSECTKCPSNSSSPSASIASTACQCNAGFSGPNGGSCIVCAAGTFKAVTGSAACDACVAGKFSTATGQSSSATCQNCLAGTYATLTGSTVCENCLAGTYATLTGSSVCANCLAGKYANLTGSSVCANCLAGTYATLTGSTVCENCLAGKFSPATGQSTAGTCQDCLAGKFGSATAQSSCQDCPALSSSAAGSSECFCNPGYWDSYVSCKQCPLGKYRDHVCLTTPCAENTCLACLSGTYARTPGQSACTKCPVGKVGKSGIST